MIDRLLRKGQMRMWGKSSVTREGGSRAEFSSSVITWEGGRARKVPSRDQSINAWWACLRWGRWWWWWWPALMECMPWIQPLLLFPPTKGLQVQVPCNSQKVESAGIPCIQTSAFLSGAATGAGLMILSIAVVTLFFSGLPRGRRDGARPPPSLPGKLN